MQKDVKSEEQGGRKEHVEKNVEMEMKLKQGQR